MKMTTNLIQILVQERVNKVTKYKMFVFLKILVKLFTLGLAI